MKNGHNSLILIISASRKLDNRRSKNSKSYLSLLQRRYAVYSKILGGGNLAVRGQRLCFLFIMAKVCRVGVCYIHV